MRPGLLRWSFPCLTRTRQVAHRPFPMQLSPGYLKIHGCSSMPALRASSRRLEPAGTSISFFSLTKTIFGIVKVLVGVIKFRNDNIVGIDFANVTTRGGHDPASAFQRY